MPTLDQHQSSSYTKSLFARFRKYRGPVDQLTGCAPWLASKNAQGYGQIMSSGTFPRPLLAHRVAWQEAGKELIKGLEILHKCNNPACVNIEHLEQGTHKQNMEHAQQSGSMRVPRKLTVKDYEFARRKVAEGFKKKDVADMIGCSPSMITKIVRGDIPCLP